MTTNRGGRLVVATATALAVGLIAVVVWGLGFVALGQYGEDLCLDIDRTDVTSYRVEATAFPPTFVCVYSTHDGDTAREARPGYAWMRVLWTVGFPALASGAGLTAGVLVWQRSQPR